MHTTHYQRRLRGLGVSLAVLALALTGCTESVEDASADYCSTIDSLDAEIASLQSLVTGDATLDQIDEQKAAIEDAYQASVDASGDLDEAVSSEADAAYDTFQGAVGDIPGDASVSQAATQYAAAAQTYLASLADIAQEAGCNTDTE